MLILSYLRTLIRTDLNAGLCEIKFSGEHFSDKDIRVMTADESLFQFFHLPRGKVGTCATSFVVADAAVGVATVAVFVLVTWYAISGTPCWLHYTHHTSSYLLTIEVFNSHIYQVQMLLIKSNIELIKECQWYFRCLLPSLNVKERCQKFISKYENSVNTFCEYCNALWMYIVCD